MKSSVEMNKTRAGIIIAVLLLIGMLVGCKSLPPDMDMSKEDIYYISPKNGDGIQDSISIPVHVIPDKWMVLFGYKLEVISEAGTIVYSRQAEAVKPGFLQKKTGLDAQPIIFWGGRDNDDRFVPDGDYKVMFRAWDDKKKSVDIDPIHVVVDNTPPSLELTIPYRIFSPNGDGNKEFIPISAVSSSEDNWEGAFYGPENKKVTGFSWKNNHPKMLEWNGTGDAGNLLPDGIYSYEASSTDRAGNTGKARLAGIGINTAPSPLSVSISRSHFSPNGDGKADTVAISPSYPQEGVDGWTLEILDGSDHEIRTSEGTQFLTYSWDGTDTTGFRVPDGNYFVKFSVLYENGNNPVVSGGPITVDTEAPFAYIIPDNLVFSPDGDGRKDMLNLKVLDSSLESLWIVELMTPNGSVLSKLEWAGRVESVVWDGTTRNHSKVEDGAYTLKLTSTDEAENSYSRELPGVRIDTRPTPLTVSVSEWAFSPNGDGKKDYLTITPEPGLKEGISGGSLSILNMAGDVIRRLESAKVRSYVWNGLTDAGTPAPDGTYRARVDIDYEKGNNPSAESATFIIDTIFPTVDLQSDYTLFSPDGDGLRDTIPLRPVRASREEEWTGDIISVTGGRVTGKSWKGMPADYIWDGRGDNGSILPDGSYMYVVYTTDAAGNTGGSQITDIRIDTRPTPISVRAEYDTFSPNNDGIKDTLAIFPELGRLDGLVSWKVTVRGAGNNVVKEYSGTDSLSPLVWDGRNGSGKTATDGKYSIHFEASYANGRNPKDSSRPVTIDTKAPEITISPEYTLFSPNGDGRKDGLPIKQQSSVESLWTAMILNASGVEVAQFSWEGSAGNVLWDGKDASGTMVRDGVYGYIVSSTDDGGNSVKKSVQNIRIDTRARPVRLESLASGLSPNNDKVKDSISFNAFAGINEGMASWDFSIVSAAGSEKNSVASGKGRMSALLSWDGKIKGTTAREGKYYGHISIEYENGDRVAARSAEFLLDITPPAASLTMAPLPFSPDDDGENDTLTLRLSATDPSGIDDWQISILDPMGNLFTQFSGVDAPSGPIIWNGKSPKGELVQSASDYNVEYKVSDSLGNRAVKANRLPVDILVIREGDRLRIQISSIYFAPYTTDWQPGKEEDNDRVLLRLAEILKKYSQYGIVIEGHAVRIYWYDEALGTAEEKEVLAPLSKARADRIKNALTGLGIRSERMSTLGYGGMRPFVPHSDLENRWKSRRVEFLLKK